MGIPNASRACRVARSLLAFCVAALSVAQAAALPPESGSRGAATSYGLLAIRDLTPFGFLRLDMRPTPVALFESQRPSIEVGLGYMNAWAQSDDVEQYMRSRPRGPLTETDAAAIRAMPGEQYLLDAEVAVFEFAFNYPIADRLGAYGVLSAARYSGGFADGLIEGFHRTFGFDQGGRTGLTRNQINVLFDLNGVQITALDQPADWGPLDPVLGLRYALLHDPTSFNLMLDVAVKIPVSSNEYFSTGRADVGAQLSAQWFAGRHAFYASAALVHYSGRPLPFNEERTQVPTLTLGYEYQWSDCTNLLVQLQAGRSTYDTNQTQLDGLRDPKYLASLGLRHRIGRSSYLTFGVTENVANYDNTADIAFQLGLGFEL